ncbi:3-methyl-2-oxobutanoate hydroxymethyltransferase [bacterium]|nr:3-methyl-2-oxobutanoate hydroxymethyltransferase [bacterium]
MAKVTIPKLKQMKADAEKITMLTAYDYPTAMLLDQAGIDILLVGDSLGMVVLGYPNTLPVTMEEMLHHTKAVCRGTKDALVVGDMPFMSYNISHTEAIKNAGRFIKEGGAAAVKLEGCGQHMIDITRAIVDAGIAVMGHIGLTPQFIHQMGGFRVQGKDQDQAQALVDGAKRLEDAGIFSLVLEGMPDEVASRITATLSIPTIGIGAGAGCDGQVLVIHDLLGLTGQRPPKFVKQYANLFKDMQEAIGAFKREVQSGAFPTKEYTY